MYLIIILLSSLHLTSCLAQKLRNDTQELSVKEEMALGREIFQKIRRDYPAYQNADVQNYISKVGAKIVKANNIENTPYEYSFTVVDVPSINAFAIPAGKIFITRPLLVMLDTEAELAGVLGHEIAHVELHHTAQRIKNSENTKSESWMYGAGGLAVGATIGAIISSVVCQNSSSICNQNIVAGLSSSGLTSALLIQKYNFFANNQKNEMDADRAGFNFAFQAGYSKQHIGDFYKKLESLLNSKKQNKEKVDLKLLDSMSTHPINEDRVKQINEITLKSRNFLTEIISTSEFNNMKKQLTSISPL